MVLDASRVHHVARPGRTPPLGDLADGFLGDASDLGSTAGRPFTDRLGNGVKPDRVLFDELAVEHVVLDDEMEYSVEERDVAPRLDGQEEIARARNRRDPRVDDDDLRASLSRLPHVARRDRRTLGDVRAGDDDELRLRDVRPRIGRAVDAESLLVGGARAHHAQAAVVVDVPGPESHAGELAHQVCLLGREARAAQDRECIRAVR